MYSFINHFFRVGGSLIMSKELAETLANLCLPLFYSSNSIEEHSWSDVQQYAHIPMFFSSKKEKVDTIVLAHLNEHHPEAWFKDMFDPEAMERIQQQMILEKAIQDVQEMMKSI
jgi:hypothetical protein